MEGGQWLQPLVFVDGTWEHRWKWTLFRKLRLSEKASKMAIGNLRLGKSGLDSTVPFFPSVLGFHRTEGPSGGARSGPGMQAHACIPYLRNGGGEEGREEEGEGEERRGKWKAALVRKWLLESIPEPKFPTTGNLIQGGDRRTSKLKSVTRPIEARGILKAGRPSLREVQVVYAR